MIFGPGPKIQEAVPSSKGSAKRLGLVDILEKGGNLTLIRLMAFLRLGTLISTSIIGLVVEFVVAIDEARVRFTDDALLFLLFFIFAYIYCYYVMFYTLQVLTKSGNSLIPRYQSSIYITRNIKYTSTQLTSIMIMINSKHEYIPHI
ncbi:hypothetical protein N7527_007802 [Penicillium freii]|nr:hypothetical protein N7527_007802 [Penicillium freii]